MARKVEVLLSPALESNYSFDGKTVVIVDVLRATSTISIALEKGFETVITSPDVEQTRSLKDSDSLIAGERNGDMIPGFDFGNSPAEIKNLKNVPKKFILTSTNGTKCIEIAVRKKAEEILCGALVNLSSLANYINNISQNDLLIFCAGWKNNENLEDTYMAGALIEKLNDFEIINDEAVIAKSIYSTNKENSKGFLKQAQHYQRLTRKGNIEDIKLCLQESTASVVPKLISYKNGISEFSDMS